MDLTTGGLKRLSIDLVLRIWRQFLRSTPPFSVATRKERGASAISWTIPGSYLLLFGLKMRTRSSGKSWRSGCLAVLSYCTFCLSCLTWSLALNCREWWPWDSWQTDTIGHSGVLQAMVNHDWVGCYGDRALPCEGPGQTPYVFIEDLSVFTVLSLKLLDWGYRELDVTWLNP